MTTTLSVATKNGFMFFDGKLRAYQFISAELDFAKGEVAYTCKLGGVEHTFATDVENFIYENEDAYSKGTPQKNRIINWSHALNAGLRLCVGTSVDQTEHCELLTIVDNEIIEVCAPVNGFVYDGYYITHPLKGKFYENKEDALMRLDIIKVDENGQETLIKSPASKVALTDEQNGALKEVMDALSKAHELGIRFIMDNCSDELYAYNDNEVKERTFDCCSDNICEWGYGINELMQRVDGKFSIIPISMDDCQTYVKFND